MDSNATCYACDHCGIPCELAALVPFKRQHICRICRDRLHAVTMPIEQVDAELREAGIDPDEVTHGVVERLAEAGIELPNAGRSTNRAEGNELAKGSTVFEDWP